ncbi:MAG: T9SS type A sorting domain-containing protein, partial [Bacteroidetes bacterium]|nr:T9SS type A sorting domain-containing protein [Bacteroidota bacterium]
RNGNVIGANSNSFTVTANGDYYVEVTNSFGCSMSSFKVNITSTEIENQSGFSFSFNIFRITTNLFELSSPSMGIVSIYDVHGKLVNTFDKRNEKVNVDFSNSTAGVYLILFSNNKNKFSKKIIVD